MGPDRVRAQAHGGLHGRVSCLSALCRHTSGLRNAANLAQTSQELKAAWATVRRVLTEEVVAGWIAQARTRPKIVEH